MLWLYRSLIELRKKQSAFRLGDYVPMRARNDVLAFKRTTPAETLLVALNFSTEPRRLDLPAPGRLLISTHLDRECTNFAASAMLRGSEGLVLKLNG